MSNEIRTEEKKGDEWFVIIDGGRDGDVRRFDSFVKARDSIARILARDPSARVELAKAVR